MSQSCAVKHPVTAYASVLILKPLFHKILCTKYVAYFYKKSSVPVAFGVNYGNTHNFRDIPSKTHKINIPLGFCCLS
jgi:hypothetical protein